MPIGIISQEEFDLELSSDFSVLHIMPAKGRGNVKEIPHAVRAFIAEEAINGASSKEITDALNISPSSISAYKNGATSTASYDSPNKKLRAHIDNVKERITKKASNRLIRALNNLDEDKMNELGARDLSGVAKDMSVIIDKMSPKADKSTEQHAHIHLYTPPQKKLEDYESIDGEVIE